MRVSLNTIRQFTEVNVEVDGLVEMINQQLGGVENTIDLGARYSGATIVRIHSAGQHPNADRLKVCLIDDAGATAGIPRDDNGYIQVVCGAPNAREDLLAVWLPPGSTVPASFDESEPFKLDARELRGVLSQGMLAAPDELGIGSDHDGILEIDPSEAVPSGGQIQPGASFAAVFGLDDTLIDIENKMFTHRPDLFGQLGVAREIAGIQHTAFHSPAWYTEPLAIDKGSSLALNVSNDAKDLSPRFMSVAVADVEVKPSPLWLQCELVRMGAKPINNIVDATNYIMLLTAQPTHAYDYEKLRGAQLGVRMARSGESVTLLNHKTYQLSEDDIVIVDGEGVVGLAGIMGGGDSEVSPNTKNIVLEVATFDMYAVRKSSMRHGIFTDALTRFNKGQSPQQNHYVLALLLSLIEDVSGGYVASEIFDRSRDTTQNTPITVSPEFINQRLGLSLSWSEIKSLLENVEFTVSGAESLEVTAPFWRTDIELREDIVEEVGRLYGFAKLPRELPSRTTRPAPKQPRLELKQRIRSILSAAGANEVLTYSFVHENIMKKSGQDSQDAYRLGNALSPDLQYYRLSVLPSLLDKVHANIKTGHSEFVLFELGKTHQKQLVDHEGLPAEASTLEMVYVSKKPQPGAAYYQALKYVRVLANKLELVLHTEPIEDALEAPAMAPYDLSRSSLIKSANGELIGIVGELKSSVRSGFKLPPYSAAATLDIDALLSAGSHSEVQYEPLPRFPKVTQDISLKISTATTYAALHQVIADELSQYIDRLSYAWSLAPISIYRSTESDEHKTVTLRLSIASFERTLTDKDVTKLLDACARKALESLQAERI